MKKQLLLASLFSVAINMSVCNLLGTDKPNASYSSSNSFNKDAQGIIDFKFKTLLPSATAPDNAQKLAAAEKEIASILGQFKSNDEFHKTIKAFIRGMLVMQMLRPLPGALPSNFSKSLEVMTEATYKSFLANFDLIQTRIPEILTIQDLSNPYEAKEVVEKIKGLVWDKDYEKQSSEITEGSAGLPETEVANLVAKLGTAVQLVNKARIFAYALSGKEMDDNIQWRESILEKCQFKAADEENIKKDLQDLMVNKNENTLLTELLILQVLKMGQHAKELLAAEGKDFVSLVGQFVETWMPLQEEKQTTFKQEDIRPHSI